MLPRFAYNPVRRILTPKTSKTGGKLNGAYTRDNGGGSRLFPRETKCGSHQYLPRLPSEIFPLQRVITKNFRLPNEIFFSKRKTFVLRFGLFVLTYERKNLVNKEEVRSESNV